MKKVNILYLIGSLYLSACSPKPAPNEDVEALHQRFHGKYQIVNSTSSEPVDINLDGKSSFDMFQEYPYLGQHELRIDIYGPNKYNPKRAFLFDQFWPEQYVQLPSGQQWAGQTVAYESGSSADFAMQSVTTTFSFSPDLRQLLIEPRENTSTFRWQRPETVTVEGNDYIRTVNKRRLYTRTGVKDVEITTLYKRYTTTT